MSIAEKLSSFKGFIVWKKSYEFAVLVHKVTKTFPSDERYGIVSLMRRACACVLSNIAQGGCRREKTEYARNLSIAYVSLSEIETQLLLSKDLGYIDEKICSRLIDLKNEIGGMLYVRIKKIQVSGVGGQGSGVRGQGSGVGGQGSGVRGQGTGDSQGVERWKGR